MRIGGNMKYVFLMFLIFSGAIDGQYVQDGDSPVTCSTEGSQCDKIGDNLIDAVAHVQTLEECRQLCLDDENCDFISYFDDSASPVSNLCQMFTTCYNMITCSNCVSQNMACYRSCGSNVVGDLDENILDLLTNIESELFCRQSCLNVPECSFYTYFYQNDTNFENFCFLQTEFVGPAQPCPACISGPVDCSDKCSLVLDGEENTSIMLTNTDQFMTGQTYDVTITGWGSCDLTLLLVGGGGVGGDGYAGGGGSGYLEYHSLQVSSGTLLTAYVGAQRESSSVTLCSGDAFIAKPGHDGEFSGGGDGYCGGGGNGYITGGDGGSNGGGGGMGSSARGGLGSGEDVTSFSFTSWNIEAGVGGKDYYYSDYYYGGGGGGVLVNGEGDQHSHYQGQGYGAGGSGYGNFDYGMAGVILIEIN